MCETWDVCLPKRGRVNVCVGVCVCARMHGVCLVCVSVCEWGCVVRESCSACV